MLSLGCIIFTLFCYCYFSLDCIDNMADTLTFLCEKISKVRWLPVSSLLSKSEHFATGSYEDTKNYITIWGIGHMNRTTIPDHSEMDEIESSQPRKICCCKTDGDVCGMEFADPLNLIAGLSSGGVVLYKLDSQDHQLTESASWKSLHKFGGSTDVSVEFPDAVSVGEDGSIFVLRIDNKSPLRTFLYGDSCPITSVKYLNSHEICTTNTMGQLRIWDVRSSSDRPSRVIASCDALTALRCVDRHPAQGHVIAAGGADGCVTLFDARKECAPVTRLQIHEDDVWEVRFHKKSPSNLFSCSEDGSVRKLNSSFEMKSLTFGASKVEVLELLSQCGSSINSLDTSGDRMICASDAESVYIVDDIL